MEGLVAQVNNLSSIQVTDPISFEDILEKALKTTAVKSNPYQKLYIGSDTYDIFWELTYKDRYIKLYGTKCIKTIDNCFIYEAVVFDEFPKDKDSYSICIGDTEEETYIELVSDTCVRFVLSKRWTDGDEFRLTWN